MDGRVGGHREDQLSFWGGRGGRETGEVDKFPPKSHGVGGDVWVGNETSCERGVRLGGNTPPASPNLGVVDLVKFRVEGATTSCDGGGGWGLGWTPYTPAVGEVRQVGSETSPSPGGLRPVAWDGDVVTKVVGR